MSNWFCYRLPGSSVIKAGYSDYIEPGFKFPGFVMSSFDASPENVFTIHIENSVACIGLDSFHSYLRLHPESKIFSIINGSDCHYELPCASTSKDEHHAEVETFIAHHQKINGGKTIAARVKIVDKENDLSLIFKNLCAAYPSACVFAFGSEKTGTWIGATPELLLSHTSGQFETMALAGTRLAGTLVEWDEKNLCEQQLVTDFIIQELKKFNLQIRSGQKFTKAAGPVEHLCTPIIANEHHLSSDNSSPFGEIALHLSPTPALCGSDRRVSMKLINDNESFRRGYYGGFFGDIDKEGNGSLFVTLRAARVTQDKIVMFAGGGITKDSNADDEWEETERKISTLLKYL